MNFRNIILPETLKCFSSDNPSMLCILSSLDTILDDDVYGAGGVESLLSSLESQLCEAEDGGVTEVSETRSQLIPVLHNFYISSSHVCHKIGHISFPQNQ